MRPRRCAARPRTTREPRSSSTARSGWSHPTTTRSRKDRTDVKRSHLLFSSAALGLLGAPILTAFVRAAEKAVPGDIAILNTAIELERAGIKAYDDAGATGLLSGHVLA